MNLGVGDYKIRFAEEKDIEDIAELKYKGDEYHNQFDLWPSECDMDEARNGVKKHLDDDNSSMFIAENQESQIIGFISVNSRNRETIHLDYKNIGEISLIYVEPDYWRKGIGTSLVKHAIEYLESKNIIWVTLRVVIYNEPGIKFWESLSFETKVLAKTTTISNVKNRIK